MTDSEERSQRVEVRIDLEDAINDLAHLRVKAERHAEFLEKIGAHLRACAKMEPSRSDFAVDSELKMRLSPDEFGRLKASADEGVALIAALRQQRQRIQILREQDAALSRSSCA